jgi:hypothetical protein
MKDAVDLYARKFDPYIWLVWVVQNFKMIKIKHTNPYPGMSVVHELS